MNDNLQDFLQPSIDSDTVLLPITFDYSGGRSDSGRVRRATAWIISGVSFVLCLLILFSKGNMGFLNKLLWVVGIAVGVSYLVRFLVLQEGKLRKVYYRHMDTDYQLSTGDFWGIYDIEDLGDGLRAAHYRSGRIGIFFSLEKDVIVGLDREAEFAHYEAISDAYNEAARQRATLIHIDYMTHVGKDPRLNELYAFAGKSNNPDMRSVLNSVYANLEEKLVDEISTFDSYIVLVSSTESQYANIAKDVLSHLLKGNFVGYNPLNDDDLRILVTELFNLERFSLVDAMQDALTSSTYSVAVPISITKGNGEVQKLNKTVEEKRIEAENQRKYKEFVRQEEERRKREARKAKKEERKANKKGKQAVPDATIGSDAPTGNESVKPEDIIIDL